MPLKEGKPPGPPLKIRDLLPNPRPPTFPSLDLIQNDLAYQASEKSRPGKVKEVESFVNRHFQQLLSSNFQRATALIMRSITVVQPLTLLLRYHLPLTVNLNVKKGISASSSLSIQLPENVPWSCPRIQCKLWQTQSPGPSFVELKKVGAVT